MWIGVSGLQQQLTELGEVALIPDPSQRDQSLFVLQLRPLCQLPQHFTSCAAPYFTQIYSERRQDLTAAPGQGGCRGKHGFIGLGGNQRVRRPGEVPRVS
jgi:hypothetical protein